MEIVVASIAGAALVASAAVTARNNQKRWAVSNGHKPGFMVEETYKAVLDIQYKLDDHIQDKEAHNG